VNGKDYLSDSLSAKNSFYQDAYGPGIQDVTLQDFLALQGIGKLATGIPSMARGASSLSKALGESGSLFPKRVSAVSRKYAGEMKIPEGTWNSASPERVPSKIWESNLGAIPGEPALVMKNGKAAVVLNEDKLGNQFYTVMTNRGKQLGGNFADHGDASRYAESLFGSK
jgi:hypothetical protein